MLSSMLDLYGTSAMARPLVGIGLFAPDHAHGLVDAEAAVLENRSSQPIERL